MLEDYDAPTDIALPEGRHEQDADAAPASTQDDGEFLRSVKQWWNADKEHSAEWREEAKEDYDFVAGDQWSSEDQSKLRDEQRPTITFNRIQPTVEAITGLEIGNRREVRFIPREEGDAQKNEILSSAADWARDECDAEDEETDAFFDCVVCGMGWTETRLDYEEEPEGKLIIDRIDPLEMYWDNSARKGNLADARRKWRVRSMPIAEARDMFPGFDDSQLDGSWARGEQDDDQPHDNDPNSLYEDEGDKASDSNKEVTIVHLQWRETEDYYRVDLGGQMQDVSVEEFPILQERVTQINDMAIAGGAMPTMMKARKAKRHKYQQAIMGAVVLERGKAPCDQHFSWECMTGKRDHNKGTWYGIVRGMKDPQRWANKWLAQSLHILNTNAKGGWMAEVGAFDNVREAEQTLARNDRITWVTKGALQQGGIQPKGAPAFPSGFENLMQFAISSIRDVSGVNLELLGLRDAQQAGVLEEQRKQAGMTILASLFNSLRHYRKRQGRVMLYFIQNYMSDGRLIRIVGEDKEQYVPLVREPEGRQYDVIVDDTANSPNQKERTWVLIMQMFPILGKVLGAEEMLALAEWSPLPTSVVRKLKEGFAEKQQQNAAKQDQIEQVGMAQMQSDVEKTKAEAAAKQAQAMADQAGINAQAQKAQLDLQAAQIKAQSEQARAQMEIRKIEQQMALERAKFEHEREMKLMELRAGPEGGLVEIEGPDGQKQVVSPVVTVMQEMMRYMNAPVQVIRDETGKVVGGQKVLN